MAELHVLRVFVAPEGTGGNPLGVFLDGAAVPEGRRQAIATDLGFSETVFVDDCSAGAVRIFTPAAELPFAGHPLVGTSWLLARERTAVAVLRPPAGEVPTFLDTDGVTWIRGRAEWAPEMSLRQLAGPEQVDALDGGPDGLDFADCWAWEDEAAGLVRSRVFAPRYGIAEDEATGAAAVRLVSQLGRPVTIRQGAGSLLRARPGPDGTAEVGGEVVLAEAGGAAASASPSKLTSTRWSGRRSSCLARPSRARSSGPPSGGGARLRGHSRRLRTTFSSAASRVTVEARYSHDSRPMTRAKAP